MAVKDPNTGSLLCTRYLNTITTTTTEKNNDIFQYTGYSEWHRKRATRSKPVSTFYEDRKCINLTSSDEDGIKSLWNLVPYSFE